MFLLQAKTSEYLLCASQCSGSRDRVMTNAKVLAFIELDARMWYFLLFPTAVIYCACNSTKLFEQQRIAFCLFA